jgi:hypothetical protein
VGKLGAHSRVLLFPLPTCGDVDARDRRRVHKQSICVFTTSGREPYARGAYSALGALPYLGPQRHSVTNAGRPSLAQTARAIDPGDRRSCIPRNSGVLEACAG